MRRRFHRVYDIALTVSSCLRSGTEVTVVWPVSTPQGTVDPSRAMALTPGGGRSGSIDPSADAAIADEAHSRRVSRLITASTVGIGSGAALTTGEIACAVASGDALPAELWDRLLAREPVALLSRLDGRDIAETVLVSDDEADEAVAAALTGILAEGRSAVTVLPQGIVTVLVPVPVLVIAGAGPIAEHLARLASDIGWIVRSSTDPEAAAGMVTGLSAIDSLVVTMHDDEDAGPVLFTALRSPVGYIGSLGGRARQEARRDWLVGRGINDISRIHGPAGLDIGGTSPAHSAVAILAEAISAHSGRNDT